MAVAAAVDELIKRRRTLNTGLRVTVKPLLLTVAGVRSYSVVAVSCSNINLFCKFEKKKKINNI